MKSSFSLYAFLLSIVAIIGFNGIVLHPQSTYAVVKGTSIYAEPAAVTPTLYCLGSCPGTTPTVTVVPSTSTPSQTTSPSQPGGSPVTSINPCDTSQTSVQSSGKHHRKRGGGFISQFFAFLIKLIEALLQLIGVQLPNPSPTPDPSISVTPGPSAAPSTAPTPCPSLTDNPSVAPTVTNPTPSTAIQPTVSQAGCTTVAGEKEVTIDGIKYPNPLTLKNGNAVTCIPVWETQRRAEILADFRQSVYGVLPATTSQSFSVQATDVGNVKRKVITVSITGPQGSGTFPIRLFIPKSSTGGKPLGTFVMLNHRGTSSDDPAQTGEYMPVAKITAAGYAIAVIDAGDTAPDDNGSYASKVLKWFYGSSIPDNGSRAVGVWAWSASRAMDYLKTDPDIDATKVAVIGHSRSGKASLWAGAQDTRFAAVISNDSGNSGAKMARRSNTGETVDAINNSFPYWFPQTYKAFANKESSLPVDQHELLALVAPRRVIVASATNDATSDPNGEFLSYVGATPVYKLYGLGNNGLPSASWQPATDKDFRGDAMSYHLRSGDHGLTNADWDMYLNGNIFDRKPQ